MSFLCTKCNKLISGSIKKFIAHLRNIHLISDFSKQPITCGQHDCKKTIYTLNGLRKHLRRDHASDVNMDQLNCDINNSTFICDSMERDSNDHLNYKEEEDVLYNNLRQSMKLFVGHLQAQNDISYTLIHKIINFTGNLINDFFESIKRELIKGT